MGTLRASMIGTPVSCEIAINPGAGVYAAWNGCQATGYCPNTANDVWNHYPAPHVVLCTQVSGTFVSVRVTGFSNALFGITPLFGIRGIAIQSQTTERLLIFEP